LVYIKRKREKLKLSCIQSDLSKAVNIVSRAVSQKETSELQKGIMLEARDGRLTLSASQPEMGITMSIEAHIDMEGSTVFSAKLFGDIVRKLPDDEVSIDKQGNIAAISCGSSDFKIIGMDPEEFAGVETHIEGVGAEFEKEVFIDLIRKTHFSASTDQSREILTGIYMEFAEGNLNAVSLDGFRMSVAYEKCGDIGMKKVIANAKMLSEASKIVAESPEESHDGGMDDSGEAEAMEGASKKGLLRMTIGERKILLKAGAAFIVINTMEGTYLKYKDLIPKQFGIVFSAGRRELHEAIDRASIFIHEGKNTYLKMSIGTGSMVITSRSNEGNVREEVAIERDDEGGDMEIGFDHRYISDVLKAIPGEEVLVKMNSPTSPCIIEPLTEKSCMFMVLPIRIA
jgi:DNA polymerase-3 subunit beta